MNLSVVIPSRDSRNLIPCVAAVRKHEPNARIVVIDDGLASRPEGCEYIAGVKPFVFSRNCNLGIEAATPDDVVLLNDDAILERAGGLSAMQRQAESHPEFGVIASTCNNVGNRNQWPRKTGLREDPRMVCFVCCLIPRRTIERVGLLDEAFVGYGHEDDDYSYRVRLAGLKVGIFDGCYCDHGSLHSTFRGDPRRSADLAPGREIFIRKWGAYPL